MYQVAGSVHLEQSSWRLGLLAALRVWSGIGSAACYVDCKAGCVYTKKVGFEDKVVDDLKAISFCLGGHETRKDIYQVPKVIRRTGTITPSPSL